ncbi:hypothetical protein BGZ50_009208 [Haplosporangium sp. Z 11]|nr:hypothetical protein BGZ50_009208 [Haplosporangium sp. Z 11]
MPSSPTPQKQPAETPVQSSTTSDPEQSITPRKRRLCTDTTLVPTAEPMRLIQERESILETPETHDNMMEQENRDQAQQTVVHSFGKKLRVQPPAMSTMKHIPGSKTTAAGVRAAAEARVVARNTTVAVATGVIVEVAIPSPSSAPVSSSSSAFNILDAIEPWTVPLANKTVRFTLSPENIPEDININDDEEIPESEQYNKTVDVVSSNVDCTSLSVTKSREMTPSPDSPSAKKYSLASPPNSPSPISSSIVENLNVVRIAPRGSTKEMRARPSTAQRGSHRFTPLGFRPPTSRRPSIFYSFNLFEDTMDRVVETNASKAPDGSQRTKKTEQKHILIGPRREQPMSTKSLSAASSSSTPSLPSSSIKATAAGVMAHKGMLPSGKPGFAIELTDDENGNQVVNHNPELVTKEKIALPLTVAKKVPEVPEIPEVPLSQENPPSKPATTQVTPKMTRPDPLSDLKVYVIPTGMHSTLFRRVREQVIKLGGKWLGLETKITDPQVVQEVPELDQTLTTHIVTALNSIDAVKWYLGIEEIDRKKLMNPERYSISHQPTILPVLKEDPHESTPPSS